MTKVLHIHSGNLYGGVETFLVTLARSRQLAPSMEMSVALCFDDRIAAELRGEDVPTSILGAVRLRRPDTVWRARQALAQRLSQDHFDVAVCHQSWPLAIFGPVVKAAGVSLVSWVHMLQTGLHWIDRLARRIDPDLVVCNSKFTASMLPSTSARVEVAYYPVMSATGAKGPRPARGAGPVGMGPHEDDDARRSRAPRETPRSGVSRALSDEQSAASAKRSLPSASERGQLVGVGPHECQSTFPASIEKGASDARGLSADSSAGLSAAAPPGAKAEARSAKAGTIRDELSTPAHDVVITQVSRMESIKGQMVCLEALAQLRDQPGWTCWQVGGAQRAFEQRYLDSLRATAEHFGISNRIRFAGERADVPDLLAASDIFCQPNLGPEGFGITFVEAMAAGLPVVTSEIGGAIEIVDETCGILVRPGDRTALAAALIRLVGDRAVREQLGMGGRERARALCDPAVQMRHIADLMEGVCCLRG